MYLKKTILDFIVLLILFLNLIPVYAETIEKLLNNGNKLLDNGKYEEAINCFNEVLKIDPKYIDALNKKGKALGKLGKHKEAFQCFDEVIKIDPKSSYAWYGKGVSLNFLNKSEEALKCYDRAIKIEPTYSNAWNNKGVILRELKKYEEAIQCFDEVIKIDPKFINAWFNKGISLGKLEKYEEAIQCFDKVIKIDLKYADAWNEKGIYLTLLGQYKEALKSYDKAIKIDPTCSNAWNNKGVILRELKKYEEAIQCFDEALEIEPNFVGVWCNKGDSLAALKKYEEAIQCYDKALDIDTNFVRAENGKKKIQDIKLEIDTIKTEVTFKTEDLKKLTININNCYYTGEKILRNGTLYVILTDFKNFTNNNCINFDYKFDGNKLILKDSVGEYEFKDPFIKDGYDVYIPIINLCKYLKFSYDYNSDKYLLNINKNLNGISAEGISLSNNLIVPNGQVGKVRLYSTMSQVIQYLGYPDSKETLKNNSYAMYYSEYDLAITYDSSYVVRAILTKSSYYKDCYGVGVGCDIEKAFDCYSGGYYSKNPRSYTNPNRGIVFNYNYNNGEITSILVFDPGYINILFNYY